MVTVPKLRPLAAAIALAMSGSSGAATIWVNGTTCTLEDAITAANTDKRTGGCRAGSGADTLNLTAPKYTLARVNNDTSGRNGLPVVSSIITLDGDARRGGRDAEIQRSQAENTPYFRLFLVDANGELTLNRITLRNGNARRPGAPKYGGAILNQGAAPR